jgi:hypothetical protein
MALAAVQHENERLHERNGTLTDYVDNLMYTVASNDLALAPPATRSKGLNPLRHLGLRLPPVLESGSTADQAGSTGAR